jgi:hypothetical protein
MARLKVCLGLVTAEQVFRKAAEVVVLIDLRSGDVKARAEEEDKASMHAKVVMDFMVQAFQKSKRIQLEYYGITCNVAHATSSNLKAMSHEMDECVNHVHTVRRHRYKPTYNRGTGIHMFIHT